MGFSPRLRSRLYDVVGGTLRIVLIVVLLLGILSVWTTQVLAPVQPAEVWVDDDAPEDWYADPTHFETIQEAINAVAEGGTVHVAAGTYNEAITIDKSLTLQGEDKTTTIIDGTDTGAEYGIYITASDVVVRGFTIKGFTSGWGWGIQLDGADNCLLEDLIVKECNSGINLYRGSDNNVVQNVEVRDIGGHGISIYGSDVGSTGNQIRNNRIIGCAWYTGDGQYHLPAIPVFSGASNNVIEDNVIEGKVAEGEKVGIGIALWGYTYGGGDKSESGNIIRDNTISNFYIGIYVAGHNPDTGSLNLVSDTEIISNTIESNKIGIKIKGFDETGKPGASNYNNIEGNEEYGVLNEAYGESVYPSYNAILNWWGDPSGPGGVGPGSGDAVSDNVDFDPWLTAPITVASSESGTDELLEFPESNVDVYVEGSAEVYVATYESNPGARLRGSIGNYIDVYVPDVGGLTELEIRKYYTDEEIAALGLNERSLMLYWWDGSAWVPCSDTGVNTRENYIWAKIRTDTTPSLTDLTGTPFGAAGKPPVGGEILSMNEPALVVILIQKNLGYIVLTALAIVAAVAIIKRRR